MTVTATAWMSRARLHVELHDSQGQEFLQVRSGLDEGQDFLLPLPDEPTCTGLAQCTGISRLHAHCWAFAYGRGALQTGSRVCFSSGTLRHRQSVDVGARGLAGRCWVADAAGVFAYATVTSPAGPGPTVRLAGR